MTTGGRFGIAFGTAAVLMAALGVAVAMSYHPVRPRVLCAMPLGTGTMAVYFGYSNEAEEAVVEPRALHGRGGVGHVGVSLSGRAPALDEEKLIL